MKFMTIIKIIALTYTIYFAVINDYLWLWVLPALIMLWIAYPKLKKQKEVE